MLEVRIGALALYWPTGRKSFSLEEFSGGSEGPERRRVLIGFYMVFNEFFIGFYRVFNRVLYGFLIGFF